MLETPKRGTRPSPSRLREALFSALQTRAGARFLDLFAGTGAIGLEAESRGFDATLVEIDTAAMRTLRANARKAKLQPTLVQADARTWVHQHPNAFDLVFAAPPYTEDLDAIFRDVVASGVLNAGGIYLLQHPTAEPLAADILSLAPLGTRAETRTYGTNTVTWLRVPK